MNKLPKIKLYHQEISGRLKDLKKGEAEIKESPIIIFKTAQGGFGIRYQCHGWSVGDKIWTADGESHSTIIAVAAHTAIEKLVSIFKNAAYSVNRFISEQERQIFLDSMEKELLNALI